MARPGRSRRADSRYIEQAALLAEWLRIRREHTGLTQEQLAARAGVAAATVRNIETCTVVEPGYFTVMALVRALDANAADVPPWRDASPNKFTK